MFKHVTPSGQTVCVVSWGGDVQVRVILPNGFLERVSMDSIGLSKSNRLYTLPDVWSDDLPTKKEAQKEIKGRYKRPTNFEVFEHKCGELREFRSFKKAVNYALSKVKDGDVSVRSDFGYTDIIRCC